MARLLFGIIIAGICLFDIPFLLLACLLPGKRLEERLGLTALASVLVVTVLLVGYQLTGIPVTGTTLLAAYGILLLAGTVGIAVTWQRQVFDAWLPSDGRLFWALAVMVILVFPYTNLPGIDTYKWQDLATAVRVDEGIPWLVHPLSLLGFTARSYPSAQPLVLATAQITGDLGVHAGYFLVSLLCVMAGLATARHLGRTLGLSESHASLVATFYALSPVFMRYTHWATGRGMFLAFVPLFIAAWLRLPDRGALLQVLLSGLVLALSHKTGLVAVMVLPVLLTVGRRLPSSRTSAAVVALLSLVLGSLLAPGMLLPGTPGRCVGLCYFALTRFGWFLPAAAITAWLHGAWADRPRVKQVAFALAVCLPFAFHSRIYAAMLSLPLLVMFAGIGLLELAGRCPQRARSILSAAMVLSLVGAIAIVGYRSVNAASGTVRTAARLLETYDPLGPYELVAPGMARRRIQAYVSGCPRIHVTRGDGAGTVLTTPPSLEGAPRDVAQNWIRYLRTFLSVPEVTTEWYGRDPRRYYVVIAGKGEKPHNAECILSGDDVEVYAPAGQAIPGEPNDL